MEDVSSKTLHHQLTIEECFSWIKIWETDDPMSMKIGLAVGKMIVIDIQSISIVDGLDLDSYWTLSNRDINYYLGDLLLEQFLRSLITI